MRRLTAAVDYRWTELSRRRAEAPLTAVVSLALARMAHRGGVILCHLHRTHSRDDHRVSSSGAERPRVDAGRWLNTDIRKAASPQITVPRRITAYGALDRPPSSQISEDCRRQSAQPPRAAIAPVARRHAETSDEPVRKRPLMRISNQPRNPPDRIARIAHETYSEFVPHSLRQA